MNNFDWHWWQLFLAIAEQGSLNKAAHSLGVSQPTLSRQLLQMEQALGQTLFDRSTQGLSLTQFGSSLIEECQRMQNSASRLQRLVSGQSQELTGRVRLSANEIIAQYYLPHLLPKFLERYPQLSLEIEVNNRASNLDKRDADVAIRMFRPNQLDLVCRHLFDIPLGFFASQAFLNQYGQPNSAQELFNYRILGYDRDQQFEQGAQALGWRISNEDFLLRTDFMPLHIQLAAAGGGIVASHKSICQQLGLIELNIGIELPALPVFLTCHRDVQHNKRIRVLMDFLAQELSAAVNFNRPPPNSTRYRYS